MTQRDGKDCNVDPVAAEAAAGRFRELSGPAARIQTAVFLIILCAGTAFILGLHQRLGLMIYNEQYLGLLLSCILVATFLGVPATATASRSHVAWYDWLLAALSLPAGLYITTKYPELLFRLGTIGTDQVVFGALAILLLLEAVRRLAGWPLLIVLVIFIVYGKYAEHFPGLLQGRPIGWSELVNYIYLDPNSMLSLLMLGGTIALAFIFFGQVLLQFGGGQKLIDLSIALFGGFAGGTGKVAVLSSSLFGSISGAPMTNVMVTGSITIPMMKSAGYRPSVAGAIESIASTGGQIMPPVMGIAAFLIAETLGISYGAVALAALVPGLLFYASFFLVVDLEARKEGIAAVPAAVRPPVARSLLAALPTAAALLVLIYLLFVHRMELAAAGLWAGVIAFVLLVVSPSNRSGLGRRLVALLQGTGRGVIDICVALAGAGIALGVINVTGMGFVFSSFISSLGQYHIVLLLVLTAITCIVLGMGMPTVAAYALVAILMVPGLTEFGIMPLAAHLFVLYFAVLSNITPPIALACFAAAPIAGTTALRTALQSMRLGMTVFFIPFIFVLRPGLILASGPAETVWDITVAAISITFLAVALTGYVGRGRTALERLAFLFFALLIISAPTSGWGVAAVFMVTAIGVALAAIPAFSRRPA